MRLSSLADYAVVVMSAIARHDGDMRFSATMLADETGVPLPTAQKLMGRLAGVGLLESARGTGGGFRSEEHTSALQSLMRISYAVFCSKEKTYTALKTDLTYGRLKVETQAITTTTVRN